MLGFFVFTAGCIVGLLRLHRRLSLEGLRIFVFFAGCVFGGPRIFFVFTAGCVVGGMRIFVLTAGCVVEGLLILGATSSTSTGTSGSFVGFERWVMINGFFVAPVARLCAVGLCTRARST